MQGIRAQNEAVDAFASGQSRITNEYRLARELADTPNNEYAPLIGFTSGAAALSSAGEGKNAMCEVANLLHHYAGVHRTLQMPTDSATIDASSYIRTLYQSLKRARLGRRRIELALAESPFQFCGKLSDEDKVGRNCWQVSYARPCF